MRKLRFVLLLQAFILVVGSSFAQKPRQDISGDYLLQTQWGGSGLYCKYAPDGHALGCHSTAVAQVLFYHKLAPAGMVKYHCSNGYTICEDFTEYSVDCSKIASMLTDSSPQEFVDATAWYNYSVACIVQKDFGTNQYVDIESSGNHKTQIEEHFNCNFESYSYHAESSISRMFKKNKSINRLIHDEIDAGRPIGLYYDGSDFEGHAIVIDGYTVVKRKFYVHANFGWSGSSDGWYLLPDDLPPGTETVILLTILPL